MIPVLAKVSALLWPKIRGHLFVERKHPRRKMGDPPNDDPDMTAPFLVGDRKSLRGFTREYNELNIIEFIKTIEEIKEPDLQT